MTTPSQKPKRPDRYAKHSGNQPNDARRFAVKSMYEAGLSVRAIAERIGVTFQSVHSMLQRMGIKMRPRGASLAVMSKKTMGLDMLAGVGFFVFWEGQWKEKENASLSTAFGAASTPTLHSSFFFQPTTHDPPPRPLRHPRGRVCGCLPPRGG